MKVGDMKILKIRNRHDWLTIVVIGYNQAHVRVEAHATSIARWMFDGLATASQINGHNHGIISRAIRSAIVEYLKNRGIFCPQGMPTKKTGLNAELDLTTARYFPDIDDESGNIEKAEVIVRSGANDIKRRKCSTVIDPEVFDALGREADERGISLKHLIGELLLRHVRHMEKPITITVA